jgi:hypothetical protein
MAKKSDPKEDPEFKAVVQHFLNTKPKPHKEKPKAHEPEKGPPKG